MDEAGGRANAPWRGVDFSGITVVLGLGVGRLIDLLLAQAAAAGGQLVALSYRFDDAELLGQLRADGPFTALRARARQLPLMDESVDLLALNGTLREAPRERLPEMAAEVLRVLVPGGQLRVADVIEATEAPEERAWGERNQLIRQLGQALGQPTALALDLRAAAIALAEAGFEDLGLSILPGYTLSEAWLVETVEAVRAMASRVANPRVRAEILERGLPRLRAAFAQGDQRAAQRIALKGHKVGSLALSMDASFTEQDLRLSDDDPDV